MVVSRCFRRVFGERCGGTFERRSGVGAVPAVRSLGNASFPGRNQSFVRAVIAVGSDRSEPNL